MSPKNEKIDSNVLCKRKQYESIKYLQESKILHLLEDIMNGVINTESRDIAAYFSMHLDKFIKAPEISRLTFDWNPVSQFISTTIFGLSRNSYTKLCEYERKISGFPYPSFAEITNLIEPFLKTCKFEVPYQKTLDHFLRQQYESLNGQQETCETTWPENVSVITESSRQTTRTIRTRREPLPPSVSLKPADITAYLFACTSYAFNFGLIEATLRATESYSTHKHVGVLSSLLDELKYQHKKELKFDSENRGEPSLVMNRFVVLSGPQEKCKLLREIAIFTSKGYGSKEEAEEVLSKLYSDNLKPNPVESLEQAIGYSINFLTEKSLLENFSLILVCQPYAAFTETKGRYEVSRGVSKTPDEMVGMFVSLLQAYPQIRALADPFRTEDAEAWRKLKAALQEAPETSLQTVEICATTKSWRSESGMRMSAAPSPAELTSSRLATASPSRLTAFHVANCITFEDFLDVHTDFALLTEIAEAVLRTKYEHNKKVEFCLPRGSINRRQTQLALAVAIAFDPDRVCFGPIDREETWLNASDWVSCVFT